MNRPLLAALAMTIFAACDNENNPAPDVPTLVPVKLEEQNYTKELRYDVTGKLKEIFSETRFVDGTSHELHHTLVYNGHGRLIESLTDSGTNFIYSFDDKNRIAQTDQYEKGSWNQKHIYHYDNQGQVIQRITYQDIPAEGGVVPVSKEIYEYDNRGNVTRQQLYDYDGAEPKLLTTYLLSEYDNKINTEEYFDVQLFNPLTVVRKNNPGKLVTQNSLGFTSSIETYSYRYNDQNFAVEKTTSVMFYNGNTGSFTTQYSFKHN